MGFHLKRSHMKLLEERESWGISRDSIRVYWWWFLDNFQSPTWQRCHRQMGCSWWWIRNSSPKIDQITIFSEHLYTKKRKSIIFVRYLLPHLKRYRPETFARWSALVQLRLWGVWPTPRAPPPRGYTLTWGCYPLLRPFPFLKAGPLPRGCHPTPRPPPYPEATPLPQGHPLPRGCPPTQGWPLPRGWPPTPRAAPYPRVASYPEQLLAEGKCQGIMRGRADINSCHQ